MSKSYIQVPLKSTKQWFFDQSLCAFFQAWLEWLSAGRCNPVVTLALFLSLAATVLHQLIMCVRSSEIVYVKIFLCFVILFVQIWFWKSKKLWHMITDSPSFEKNYNGKLQCSFSSDFSYYKYRCLTRAHAQLCRFTSPCEAENGLVYFDKNKRPPT